MFRKHAKVMYPRHGAGKIVGKKKIRVEEKEKKYYKIEFFNSPISISIPQGRAEELGLRKPLSKYKLRSELKKLGNRVKITDSLIKNLDTFSQEKLLSGEAKDAIGLVNTLRSLARKKEKESKNFSYSASQYLETALNFIRSEVELVLGKKSLLNYKLGKG